MIKVRSNKMQKSYKAFIVLILAPLFLAGCEEKNDDLNAWIQSVKNSPVPAVKPLPDVKPYKAFVYQASNLHSPFMKVVPGAEGRLADIQGCGINDPKPNPNRRKEQLEKMPINTLSMVGAIEQNGDMNAIIRDESTGLLYQVKKDQYMGLNNGKISGLTETMIKLVEIVPNGRGCWESRNITLELGE